MITPQQRKAEEMRRRARNQKAALASAESRQIACMPLNREVMDAVDRGNEAQVKMLLKEGQVCLHKRGVLQATPLHLASKPFIARELLGKGADINALTSSKPMARFGSGFSMGGNTPLQHVAFSGHHDVARVLLESKADARAMNDNGDTALNTAATALQHKIVKLLENPGEAVAKARKEMRETLAKEASEKAVAQREAVKTRRRKENKHRRTDEEDAQRAADEKRRAVRDLFRSSNEVIPAHLATRLSPLMHYP